MASPAKGAVGVFNGKGSSEMRIVAMAGDAGDFPLVKGYLRRETVCREQGLVFGGQIGVGGADNVASAPLGALPEEAIPNMYGVGAVMTVQASG
jgi:hypothetical protein